MCYVLRDFRQISRRGMLDPTVTIVLPPPTRIHPSGSVLGKATRLETLQVEYDVKEPPDDR